MIVLIVIYLHFNIIKLSSPYHDEQGMAQLISLAIFISVRASDADLWDTFVPSV